MSKPSDEDILRFKEWLAENGANFEKIDWPSADTNSGIRGAVALDDIATNEVMVTVPARLMLSPESAFRDPVAGTFFKENVDILRGDLLLTQYLVYELSKGEISFYYPYLKILPEPGSITKWSESELDELQHEQLKLRAERKRSQIKIVYNGLMTALNSRHPDFFTPEIFTLERFCFAFDTIQARAFGRRLPWTALVPFADCLNHGNLQTKYSFDSDERVFRLFPTGSNAYDKGCEVFNSYGRRPNDNLLLDYGFSMMGNEWDEVIIPFKLPLDEKDFDHKVKVLRSYGEYYTKKITLNFNYMPEHIMSYFRVSMACRDDLLFLENSKKTEDRIDRPLHLYNERNSLDRLRSILISNLTKTYPTTEEEDTIQWAFLRDEVGNVTATNRGDDSAENAKWKLLCALNYRITRKRILKNAIMLMEEICDWIDKMISARQQESDSNDLPSPREIYETISQFYLLPQLESDDCGGFIGEIKGKSNKAATNPPYDKSAGKATPFLTMDYLCNLYSLRVDAVATQVSGDVGVNDVIGKLDNATLDNDLS